MAVNVRCCDDLAAEVSVAEARRILAGRAVPVAGVEEVALAHAAGRVLARDLVSPRDVPAFANVAVDGYAFAAASLVPGGETRLRLLAGRAAAGHPFPGPVPLGHAVRALTGAPLPAGCDTVVLQEAVRIEGGEVVVPEGVKPGANVRATGEDVAAGSRVFPAGIRLGPQHLGVAAELGLARLPVFRRVRVALFSSGDELVEPGEEPAPGRIFDANRPMLRALVSHLPVELTDLGILPDRFETVAGAVGEAARTHDLVLTSGGASAGDEDHLSRLLRTRGEAFFWRVAMKPGRPLAFGRLERAFVLALPGNPVAAALAFLLFARPFLLALAGAPFALPPALPVPAAFSLKKKRGRTEFARARLVVTPEGNVAAERVTREGSGILTSLTEAGGILELEAERGEIRPGEPVLWRSLADLGCGT